MKTLLIFLFSISLSHAFTLNNNFGAAFSNSRVKVSVAGNTSCSNAGITAAELENLIKPAINHFWNEVSTSKLRLKSGGFSGAITNINSGVLCSPTDDTCITNAGGNLIPPVDNIIIGCNDNCQNFDTDPACPNNSTNVLAVTIPNKFSGKNIKGSVIIINEQVGSAFANLSHDDRISVIAHEIGHAIGLGHSKDKNALMYYRTVDMRKALGQDDIDGVSYLYPVKFDGCGLFGGTITTDRIDPQMWQMGISFTLFLLILSLMKKILKLLNRSKRSPTF